MPSAKKKKTPQSTSHLLFFVERAAVILVLTLTALNLQIYFQNNFTPKKVLGTQTDLSEIVKERDYWLRVVSQNESYIDGWIELSKIEHLLGNEDLAVGALNTALSINPNYEKLPKY